MRNETSYPAKKQTAAKIGSIDELATDTQSLQRLSAHIKREGITILSISIKNEKQLRRKTLFQVLEAEGVIRTLANAGVKELIFEKCVNVGFPQSAMAYRNFERITVMANNVMAVEILAHKSYYSSKALAVQKALKEFGDCQFYLQTPLQQGEMQFNTNPA